MKRFVFFCLIVASHLYSWPPELDRIWDNFLSNKRNVKVLELAALTHDGFKEDPPETDERLLAVDAALKDYNNDSFEASLHAFIEEHFQIPPSEVTIVDYHRNATSPERTLIFFVYNSSKKLVTIIKAFHERMSFVKGFSSLWMLYNLNLKFSTTVAPLGIGKTMKNGKPIYLLAESVAPGKTIQEVIFDLKKTRGEERKQQFLIVKTAIGRLAQAIAELHFKPFEKTGVKPFRSEGLASLAPICDPLPMENLIKHEVSIDFKVINEFLKDLDKCITLFLPEKVFAHGDLNWVNVFYEPTTNQLTFIDLITFHRCIDKNGEPAAPYYTALRDFYTGYRRLDGSNRTVFTKAELRICEENYRNIYTKGVAISDDEKMIELYWRTLGILGAFAQHVHSFKHPDLMPVKVRKVKEKYRDLLRVRDEFYKLRNP